MNIRGSLIFGLWTFRYNLLESRFVQDDNLIQTNSNLNIQVIKDVKVFQPFGKNTQFRSFGFRYYYGGEFGFVLRAVVEQRAG